ncbi:hypothetical protein C8R43DRAFT_1120855 [Mycena crocata]|nr:hypothetical protein C8R43DRAFT_1120855 [Mycena crocata]
MADSRQKPDKNPPADAPDGENPRLKRHLNSDKCKDNILRAEELAKKTPKKTAIHVSLKAFFFKPKAIVPSVVPPPALLKCASVTPISPVDVAVPAGGPIDASHLLSDNIPMLISTDAQHLCLPWTPNDTHTWPGVHLTQTTIGVHGLDGFVRFIDFFVEHRGLQAQNIRRYIDILLRAIESRFPTAADSAGSRDDDRFTPGKKLVPCIGMQVTFPDGKSHHTDYPFGLHRQFTLPCYYSKGEPFFIQSQMHTRGLCEPGKMCRRCNELSSDNMLVGILDRIRNGIPENSTFIFMPISVLIDALRNRVQQYRGLKLTRLNDLRKLFGKLT